MYRIDYTDLGNAADILYCFMTLPSLSKPECCILRENGLPETIVNDGSDFMNEDEFCSKIIGTSFLSITCVASTDIEGKHRVVLSLMQDMDYMVLNFPTAKGIPNAAEKRLLSFLEI